MFIQNAVILPLALLVDRLLGDPVSRWHPVALIGSFIGWWGRPGMWPPLLQRAAGVVMWVVTVLLFALPFFLAGKYLPGYVLLVAGPILLKFCLAWRALEEHAVAVSQAMVRDLGEGQRAAAMMVSRDTRALDPEQVRSAAYESMAENLVDSIIAPLFYFGLFGLAGAAVFRAANTLDAMLGYRDERERLGWCAARMDDILNFIPARIAGALLLVYFGVHGRFAPAYAGFKSDRRKRPGINGGIPMAIIASGAGVRFEKPGYYVMGTGERPLAEGCPAIIAAVRAVTLAFGALVSIVLLLVGSGVLYTGL